MLFKVSNDNILGIQRCIRDPKNTFQSINHNSSHFRPNIEAEYEDSDMQKIAIFAKNEKNLNFLKAQKNYMAGNGYLRCFRCVLHPESKSNSF